MLIILSKDVQLLIIQLNINSYLIFVINKFYSNSNAIIIIGYMYYIGVYVKQDYDKAIELYNKAIELNNSYAMNNLAYMYEHGKGVKQDYNKAIELYNKAIELNNPYAMNNLAYMYKMVKELNKIIIKQLNYIIKQLN